jgi:hypothetical protein
LCSQEPWARSIKSIPTHPISLRFTSILSIHLCLCLSSGLFPTGFHTNILYALLFSLIRATCSAHLILLDLIILITLGEGYKLLSSSFCSFFQPSSLQQRKLTFKISYYKLIVILTHKVPSCHSSVHQILNKNNAFFHFAIYFLGVLITVVSHNATKWNLVNK